MENVSRRLFLEKLGIGVGTTALTSTLPTFVNDPQNNHPKFAGKKLNIALCGLGRYAGYLAEGLEISSYCKLSGIVTGTPSKAIEWSKKYQIPQAN